MLLRDKTAKSLIQQGNKDIRKAKNNEEYIQSILDRIQDRFNEFKKYKEQYDLAYRKNND